MKNRNEAISRELDYNHGKNLVNYDIESNRKSKYDKIINHVKPDAIEIPNAYNCYLYREKNKAGQITDIFLDKNKIQLIAIVTYNRINDDLIEVFKWRYKNKNNPVDPFYGLVRKIYINYYLKHGVAIVSDNELSENAFKSWKEMVKEVLNVDGKACIVDKNFNKVIDLYKNNYDRLMELSYKHTELYGNEDTYKKFSILTNKEISQLSRLNREDYYDNLPIKKKKKHEYIKNDLDDIFYYRYKIYK